MSSEGAEFIGVYALHQKVGEGGMGAVYLATNRLTGQKAALKKVLASNLHEETFDEVGEHTEAVTALNGEKTKMRAILAREFQTMATLHHPNIVEVLDYGFDSVELPYFTMELLDSPQTLVEAGVSGDIKFKVELLVQLLRALAYLHHRGILHRDIKPSNVLVVNNQVKLVDFGIAEVAGASQNLAGTIHYMAPELFLGAAPSKASDLYAVGIVAFELFTSRHPYATIGGQTQLLEHLLGERFEDTLAPGMEDMLSALSGFSSLRANEDDELASMEELLTESTEGYPKLIATVLKLLDRSASDRYQDPNQVIRDLSEAIGQPLPTETAVTRDSFLQAAEFIGREAEIAQITEGLDQADAGNGSVWMISGESGVGKSRLSKELRVLALIRAACVINSQGVTESVASYGLWNRVIRTLCLNVELDDSEIAILRDIASDIESLLGRTVAPAPALPPQAAQARLYATVLSLLRKQRQLVVLILEDLHWAGSDSLDLLSYLNQHIGSLRVFILCNHREDEATDELRAMTGIHRMRLERLPASQISKLSESMLGEVGRRPEIVEYLKQHTEGNIFFIVETVRALAEMAGRLDQIGVQALPKELLTGGIGRIVQHRLKQVPPEFAPLLNIVAVAGRQLDLKVIGWVWDDSDLAPFLRSCADASVLEYQQNSWQFTHDKIREWLNSHLAAPEQRRLHGRVAEAITALYPDDRSKDATLGYHWEKANALGTAYSYYIKAGSTAAQLYAIGEARAHYSAALSILDRMEESPDNSRAQADTFLKLLSISQHWLKLPELVARLPRVEQHMDALIQGETAAKNDVLLRAQLTLWKGRYSALYNLDIGRTIQHCEEVRALAKKHRLAPIEALALLMMAQCKGYQGYLGECTQLLKEAAVWLESKAPSVDWVRWAALQGLVLICQGQRRTGEELLNKAMQHAKDPQTVVNTMGLAALAYKVLLDWPRNYELVMKAVTVNAQSGDKRTDLVMQASRALSEAQVGNIEASDRAQQMYDLIFDKQQIMLYLDLRVSVFAEALLVKNRLQEAITVAQRAISIGESIGAVWGPAIGHRIWAQALARLESADHAEVASHFEQSIEMLKRGELWLEVAHSQLGYADVLASWGERARAVYFYALAMQCYEGAELTPALDHARQQLVRLTS